MFVKGSVSPLVGPELETTSYDRPLPLEGAAPSMAPNRISAKEPLVVCRCPDASTGTKTIFFLEERERRRKPLV